MKLTIILQSQTDKIEKYLLQVGSNDLISVNNDKSQKLQNSIKSYKISCTRHYINFQKLYHRYEVIANDG